MSTYDHLFHGRSHEGSPLTLAVKDGRIEASGSNVSGSAESETTLHANEFILPGWIDAHVHFNEPGRADWEGLTTGSRALAAGGGTTFFDMPLNSSPPVLSADTLNIKRSLAEEKSCLDFALWGGLTPTSLDHLEPMAKAGAIGFKAFMCPSGLDEFPHTDAATLKEGMSRSADLQLPIAVHAEIDPTSKSVGCDMAAWLSSRPIELELEAITLALDLARTTGCALHIVHVSCAEGVDLISAAKNRSIDVTVETCPHYLLLNTDWATEIGAAAKCAPPLRQPEATVQLYNRLMNGNIDTIGSDHSPAPLTMKTGSDMFSIWGGIAGIQHGLPLLLDHLLLDNCAQTAEVISSNVARRFRIPNKGSLTPGKDADFCIWRKSHFSITECDLLSRHPISPYLGMSSNNEIKTTYLRGIPVDPKSPRRGKFLTPSKS